MQHFLLSLLFAFSPAWLSAQHSGNIPLSPSTGTTSNTPKIIGVTSTPESCGVSNGTLKINATGEIGVLQYSIDGSSFQLSSSFRDLKSGNYTIAVMDESGRMVHQNIFLPAQERIDIADITSIPSVCTDNTGAIKVIPSDDNRSYIFSLNGGTPQTEADFLSLAPGEYSLHIADETGCSLDTMITIDKEACPVYIPNIFSPNGDGVNDLFRLQAPSDQNIMITRFFIFDNWGNNVFEKFNLPIQSETGWWDGTYKRFTANPGMFAYYVEVQFENGKKETYKGKVTLIR
jgi:gliding motility-associated-like protein